MVPEVHQTLESVSLEARKLAGVISETKVAESGSTMPMPIPYINRMKRKRLNSPATDESMPEAVWMTAASIITLYLPY